MWYVYLTFEVSWTEISQNIEFQISLFLIFAQKSFLFYRGALSQANKDEKGCLGPKECKYVSLSPKKHFRPEFIQNAKRGSICFPPQQARRSTDYKLRFEHRHLCEPRWMLKLFCKLCTRMLLSSLSIPTSSSYGKTHPFQCWQYHQCGWMYKSLRRSWFHACWTQVSLSEKILNISFGSQGSSVLPLWQC